MNVPTRILLITGDAGESYECLYARHRLLEAGYLPAVAAPSRRRLHLVIHDFEPGWDTYIERQGYGADADLTFDDVRVDDYAAVLVLGGRAPDTSATTRACWRSSAHSTAPGSGSSASATACRSSRPPALWSASASRRMRTAAGRSRRPARPTSPTNRRCGTAAVVTGQTWQSHPEFYRLVFECLTS